MKADEVDVVALAMLGHFEQVKDAGESGLAGQLRSDVGQADGRDGLNLDFAVAHAVAVSDDDMRTGPDADAAGDLAADDALAQALGEDHETNSVSRCLLNHESITQAG